MGVPKFFRWISERYPKIIQRYGNIPNEETYIEHFPDNDYNSTINNKENIESSNADLLSLCTLPPPIDRLYIDMNGIIHGCSHNNSDQTTTIIGPVPEQNNDKIYSNICFYLDRIIKDIVQPTDLVFMAIDGVAPRAKLNQQRARRYRSGKEGEIEQSIYDLHMKTLEEQQQPQEQEKDNNYDYDNDYSNDPYFQNSYNNDTKQYNSNKLKEVEPGRFTGKFKTTTATTTSSLNNNNNNIDHIDNDDTNIIIDENDTNFHSNTITPGTEFFQICTEHIENFIQYKLTNDPAYKNLTIILSGSNVPGEGEHKILQFMREQKMNTNTNDTNKYNPNLRHCIMGQDGDLIMLGLITHEPNLVLLREKVLFGKHRKDKQQDDIVIIDDNDENTTSSTKMTGIDTYIYNQNFEFLHMNILRDYLAYEFGTSNVKNNSKYDIERTIDDFIFLTLFVGNDFLPHMPALDIADNAFDLLFYTYREQRELWIKKKKKNDNNNNSDDINDDISDHDNRNKMKKKKKKNKLLPYLTDSGNILCGKRLEEFLSIIGSHEMPYYDNKKSLLEWKNEKFKDGGNINGPSSEIVLSKEEADRIRFREILESGYAEAKKKKLKAVLSTSIKDSSTTNKNDNDEQEGILLRMVNLLKYQLGANDSNRVNENDSEAFNLDDKDLKGRYYHDKFGFSPFDIDKHIALRKAYIEGLVWNLKYYYQGCVSWDWFYPYHYGPMISDLVNLDNILSEISFDNKLGKPLKPFEQLMACMPPSQAKVLPKPYRPLMTEPDSPIADFYPTSFTIDMNGKRWPWEAVVLLPFINTQRLLEATKSITEKDLLPEEIKRNQQKTATVFKHNPNVCRKLETVGIGKMFTEFDNCNVEVMPFEKSQLYYNGSEVASFQPTLVEGVEYPLPAFPTLRNGSVQSVLRRKINIRIHGSPSRYTTSILTLDNGMPEFLPIETIASELIGTLVYINYPHFIEAYVTSVSNSEIYIRGKSQPKNWTIEETMTRKQQVRNVVDSYIFGTNLVGDGGIGLVGGSEAMDDLDVMLTVRPFSRLATLEDGTKVKTYSEQEITAPLFVTSWVPVQPDYRLDGIPLRLEKDPFSIKENEVITKQENVEKKVLTSKVQKEKINKSTIRPMSFKLSSHKLLDKRSFHTDSKEYLSSNTLNATSVDWRELPYNTIKSQLNLTGIIQQFDKRVDCVKRESALPRSELNSVFANIDGKLSLNAYLQNINLLVKLVRGKRKDQSLEFLSSPLRLSSTTCLQTLNRNVVRKPHGRVITIGVLAIIAFFSGVKGAVFGDQITRTSLLQSQKVETINGVNVHQNIDNDDFTDFTSNRKKTSVPDFFHGTTTISFVFKDGIVTAVDSRASLGSYVGSKTTQKVLPINSHVLGTMAGGAADCSFWIRKLRSEAALYELTEGRRMSVARSSRLLSNALYENRDLGLSVGTMIMGFDDVKGRPPMIYYVDSSGSRIEGDVFAVGSGSTFALGILDTASLAELSVDEAVSLGIRSIRHATFRDASSGGFINVYLITRDGWKLVFSEDLDRSPDSTNDKLLNGYD